MKNNNIKHFFYLYGATILLLTTACTRNPLKPITERQRNHEHVFVDETAEDVYNIKNFQIVHLSKLSRENLSSDQILKIKTSRTGEEAKISISQTGTFIDPKSNVSFVNRYYFLNYKIIEEKTDNQKLTARLLGKLKSIKGFPNTPYYIVPQLEGNYLILYRVAQKNKIPYNELPISVQSNSWVATPLVGYPIEYCIAKVSLNINNEKTGKHIPQCIGISKSSAQYIRLREDRKQVFKYKSKIDIFPKDFFNGQWFYIRTIIKSPERNIDSIGHQPFASANLVEFKKTSKSLNIVDASGYQMKEEDRVATLFIPVEWKEYEIDRDSDIMTHFSEREKVNTVDITRPYFKIRFEDLIQTEQKDGIKEIKNVFITDDYFSFKIATHTQGRGTWTIKYAFKKRKNNSSYIEKQWFEADSSQFFPAFKTIRKYYKDISAHTKQDNEHFFRTTRFDPQSKVIKWYFSKQTSKEKWVRDIGRTAISHINTVFQKAGEGSDNKITVVLDESEDKELGDIRYNILNLIVTKSTTNNNLLGLGPNISNPITGEIVSATANVWVTSITDIYTILIRQYIRFNVYPPPWKLLPSSPGITDFLHEKIQNLCPKVKKFITKQREKQKTFHPKLPPLSDKNITRECTIKIAQTRLLETTLHEILHGFGLRHVFSASTDKGNYYKSYNEIKDIFGDIPIDINHSHPHPPKYASVMDYSSTPYPILSVPGKYDIAAIRFLYFDKIELNNGKLLEISAGADRNFKEPQKSILESTEIQGVPRDQLKRYKVCGGRKTADIDIEDPLCERQDYGSTPSEIVKNITRINKDLLMTSRNRYDSESTNNIGLKRIVAYTRQHLRNIQAKWTWHLANVLHSQGKNILDFSALSDIDISSYLKILENKYRFRDQTEFKEYYEARKILYDYYKEMFFLPAKHCIYQKSNGSYKAMAMEIILKEIQYDYFDNIDKVFTNCQSPVVQKWAEKKRMGSFVTEVGYFINNIIYFFKYKHGDYFDEISPFVNPYSVWDATIDLMQSVLHEPDFRKDFYDEITQYFLYGTNLNPYINNLPDRQIKLPRFLNYRIDTLIRTGKVHNKKTKRMQRENLKGLLPTRLNILNTATSSVRKSRSLSVVGNLTTYVGYQPINTNIRFNTDIIYRIPFLHKKYREYLSNELIDKNKVSFLRFLQILPSVYSKPYSPIIIVPYEKGNMIAKQHEIYNQYKKCIRSHGTEGHYCENMKEKRVYVQIIDKKYK